MRPRGHETGVERKGGRPPSNLRCHFEELLRGVASAERETRLELALGKLFRRQILPATCWIDY